MVDKKLLASSRQTALEIYIRLRLLSDEDLDTTTADEVLAALTSDVTQLALMVDDMKGKEHDNG